MQMIYGVKDKPPAGKLFLFALQQLLAILAATIAVPTVVNGNVMTMYGFNPELSQSAALFGAGVGTIVYLLFTRFKSPVFLGSSFAFIGSMTSAFAGGIAACTLGYLGLIIGAVFAGLVYVIISVIVKFCGTKWIDKVMPAVVIGPTVAIIGLSLSGNAVGDFLHGNFTDGSAYVSLVCGLVTLAVTIVCSVYGKKMMKMIPFIIGIVAGYVLATIFTAFSYIDSAPQALQVIDFSIFDNLSKASAWYPNFSFLNAFKGSYNAGDSGSIGAYIGSIAVAYIPVAFVVFAEHLADHKNISSIIEHDLTKDPGLSRTLLGDGVGSMAGAIFGGAPNTTYGESVGCVAISGNASIRTIFVTACMAIVVSFIAPFVLFLATIPSCVMGGVCIALYGFIAVSGLKMIQKTDLGDNRNLFTVSVILIAGVGGMALTFGKVTITNVACALILGILTNVLVNIGKKKEAKEVIGDGTAEDKCLIDQEQTEETEEGGEVAEEAQTPVEEDGQAEAAATAESAATSETEQSAAEEQQPVKTKKQPAKSKKANGNK